LYEQPHCRQHQRIEDVGSMCIVGGISGFGGCLKIAKFLDQSEKEKEKGEPNREGHNIIQAILNYR
jgi:hypothetical protein